MTGDEVAALVADFERVGNQQACFEFLCLLAHSTIQSEIKDDAELKMAVKRAVHEWVEKHIGNGEASTAAPTHTEPLNRFVSGKHEVAVFAEGVLFLTHGLRRAEQSEVWIPRPSLVSVHSRNGKHPWEPDIVVVLYRDADGDLEWFRWSFAEKGVARKASNAIYQIIDGRFFKSFVGFSYFLTHRLDRAPHHLH